MKTHRSDRPATRLGSRGIVLFAAGALAMGLGVAGVHSALAGGTTSPRTRPVPSITFISSRPTPTASTTPTARPKPDPNAMADGVYPTYIRAVNVRGATITFDVIQTFFGEAAHQAAILDGVTWSWVQYDPVYIRNVSPLLRTLPVALDAHIKLIHICMAPDRRVGLVELRKAITPFTTSFYYEVSVVGGSVESIRQLVAVAAC